ncbi:MAG TPA: hypothetical protein DEF36_04175 [Desulfotomaculum sp.]|nr:hypothetical protein [Desulfotomaculum sp.]
MQQFFYLVHMLRWAVPAMFILSWYHSRLQHNSK